MPINQAMFEALQPGVNKITEGRNNQQQEQLRAYLEGQATNRNLKTAQQYIDDNAKKGRKVSASVGGNGTVALSQNEPNQFAQMAKLSSGEGQKLYGEAKKQVGPVDTQFQALSMMHQLLDNPNSIDQKQLGALGARLTEGQGQRLLQSLVESLGAPSSIAGDSVKSSNWVLGQAKSGLTAAQSNAFRENLFKHQAQLESQYNDGKQQFMQAASLIAPHLGPDQYQQAIGAATNHTDSLLKDLGKRRSDYEASLKQQVVPSQLPAQQAQPQSMMDKTMSGIGQAANSLGTFFQGMGGNKGTAPASPQAPMNFEDWKKANGR